jgi:DNA-binding Xre family transcriptional regulator
MKNNTNNAINQPSIDEYKLIGNTTNIIIGSNLIRIFKYKYGSKRNGCKALNIKESLLNEMKLDRDKYKITFQFIYRCCILLNCLPGELLSPLSDNECKTIAARNNSFFSLCGLK